MVPLEMTNTGQDGSNLTVSSCAGHAAFTLPQAPVVSAAAPLTLAPGEARVASMCSSRRPPPAQSIGTCASLLAPPPPTQVNLSGTGVAAAAANLLASVVHFMGLDDGDDTASGALA